MTRRQKKSPPSCNSTGKAVFEALRTAKTNSPGSTRTNDPLINSQLLYRLSYWGRTSIFRSVLKDGGLLLASLRGCKQKMRRMRFFFEEEGGAASVSI